MTRGATAMDSYSSIRLLFCIISLEEDFLKKNGKSNDKYSRIEYVLLHVAF